MKTTSFEIRVAVIGNVCAGKTTVLNALLGDKFSETSMKRTTAGVNLFYLQQTGTGEGNNNGKMDWSVLEEQQPSRSAESIHKEISTDNRTLRSSRNVVEKIFNVQLSESLCEMRNDTQLVLVDVPGINEADSSLKYKKYVEVNWSNFDCVIVVMDAVQGVNTQEQVDLLSFVRENNRRKDIPTIILGNKVDDPEHEAKLELVHEAREKAVEIFGDSCSEQHLDELQKLASEGGFDEAQAKGAVFVPISAAYAFLYRKVGKMTSENLESLDQEILDGIGQQEIVPKKWSKLSHKRKCEVVLEIINDTSEYKESLKRTNFHKFLSVLRFYIGGSTAQKRILSHQITFSLEQLSPTNVGSLSDRLSEAYSISRAIDRPTDDLVGHFWRVYEIAEAEAMKRLESDANPSDLSPCFVDLEKFCILSMKLGWSNEQDLSVKKMQGLVASQLSHLSQKKKLWSFQAFRDGARNTYYCGRCPDNKNGCGCCYSQYYDSDDGYHKCVCGETRFGDGWKKPKEDGWMCFSPQDWIIILSSFLLPSNEIEYYKTFGAKKIMLDWELSSLMLAYNLKGSVVLECLSRDEKKYLQEARKCPVDNDVKAAILKVKIPSSLDDPKHWGHLGYKYVCFQRYLNAK